MSQLNYNDFLVSDFINFLNASCSAFHAVQAARNLLTANGFIEIKESERWTGVAPGSKCLFTRNGTTLIAFTGGELYKPDSGYTVIGAHTDSPCLKIKPTVCSKKGLIESGSILFSLNMFKGDALVLNTQPYGGGLWHTW
jgi:aspartyl aminopeptidase